MGVNMKTETIAAIATAMSNGGIGIIRISGDDSLAIISKIFKSKHADKKIEDVSSHTAHYGQIVDDGRVIDECIVLIMKGPNTYTKEDVVEIDCHGGIVVMTKILETVIKYGARPAEPGEFTRRAFLNGRIDLSQAEAVMDIIGAKNDFALESSVKQLSGIILEKIKELRQSILHNIAFIESALDDPEHVSLDGYSEVLNDSLIKIELQIEKLLLSADNGKVLKEGINTVIVGKPNAGKSSLLNVLVGEDRAIVTDVEGTTRDTLEESIYINGIPLNIIDTAGIRETDDIVEKIGVEKAKKSLDKADLVLYVADASRVIDENDSQIIELIKGKRTILLLNKSDLNKQIDDKVLGEQLNSPIVEISSKEKSGFEELYDILKEQFLHGDIKYNDEIYITNIRHKTALKNTLESIKQVRISIEQEMPEDFYSIDLMNAYEELGYIIGESVGEDLVNEIFSKFCTGK